MFGLKTKKTKKQIKAKPTSPSTKTEKVKVEVEEVEKIEPLCEEKKFNLSHALGITEEKMENDFYVFQIREFMKKVGLFILLPTESISAVEKSICLAKKHHPSDILITPSVYQKLIENSSKVLDSPLSIVIDYPYGLGSYKSRKSQLNEYKTTKLQSIILSMPSALDTTFIGEKDKSQTQKILKKAQNSGMMISAEQGEEAIKKTAQAYKNVKMQSIILSALNLSGEGLLSAVRCALENKGDKSLYVLSNVKTSEELGEITALGVDRVYTPYAIAIGEELLQKFSVTI